MKKTFDSFVDQFKKNSYYTGPKPPEEQQPVPKEEQHATSVEDRRAYAFEKFKSRRSIRKYSTDKVPWKCVYEIVCGALNAPVAGGIENTEVIVIQDKKKKCEISKIENQQFWLADAPYLLVFVRDNERTCSLYPDNGEVYAIQNTAAVIENALMLAHFYDLGACWVESSDSDVLKDYLGISPNKYVDAVVPIGYPLENPEVSRAYDNSKIYFEEFGNRDRPRGMN